MESKVAPIFLKVVQCLAETVHYDATASNSNFSIVCTLTILLLYYRLCTTAIVSIVGIVQA